MNVIRSRFNAKKYLDSSRSLSRDVVSQQLRSYAVIFGAGTKAGQAFAIFLAERKFNLILIDKEEQPLKNIDNLLLEKIEGDLPLVFKVVMKKFDEESIKRNLNNILENKNINVKFFINCKNFKKQMQVQLDLESQDQDLPVRGAAKEKIAGPQREEVFLTCKENIEGYAILSNLFIPQLIQQHNAAVINIDTEEKFNSNNIQDGQLMLQSSLRFQDTFTSLISKKIRSLKSINVKINMKKLKNKQVQQKLCNQTFAYLGIEDTISIS